MKWKRFRSYSIQSHRIGYINRMNHLVRGYVPALIKTVRHFVWRKTKLVALTKKLQMQIIARADYKNGRPSRYRRSAGWCLVPAKLPVWPLKKILFRMSALLLIAVIAFAVYKLFKRDTVTWKRVNKYGENQSAVLKEAPGPTPLPLIGSLHLLGKHESPFQAFTDLAKEYGDIFSIKLGTAKCLVVNNLALIREVLNQNGNIVAGRPDFLRFHELFAGDRNNCEYFFF